MKYLLIVMLFSTAYQCTAQYIITDKKRISTNVYFQLGSAKLTTAAKHTIDSLLYNDVVVKGRMVGIIGYTDNIGGEEANSSLSIERANAVAAYLRYMGIDSMYIEQVTGMGEVNRANKPEGYPEDRKVIILPGGFVKPDKVEWTDSGTLVATLKFKFGTMDLLPQSAILLDTVLQILKKNPRMNVKCDGYVCCHRFKQFTKDEIKSSGLDEDKFRSQKADEISQERAKHIYQYLVKNGIDSTHMRYEGSGFRKNIVIKGVSQHGTDRVEIRSISKLTANNK